MSTTLTKEKEKMKNANVDQHEFTARVKADKARIDRLKERNRSTPQELDFERIRIMKEVYEATPGDVQILRRAKFLAALLERKKLFIDDNLFVGAMAGSYKAIYPNPEWNVLWMKEEKTVEKSKTKEDKEANAWALDYWDERGLKSRTESIFQQRYGFDPAPCYESGLVVPFHDWPGGGGNLNYPMVYQQGLASVIKDVEERMMSLEMRLENTDKLYFYQASLIVMKAMIRWANRYAELAREMAAKRERRNPQGGIDRHCRDLRACARAPGPQPAGGHAVPFLLSPGRRT